MGKVNLGKHLKKKKKGGKGKALPVHGRAAKCWPSIPALQRTDTRQASSTLQQGVPLYFPGVTSPGPSHPPCRLFLLVLLTVLAGARRHLGQMLQHNLADRFGA